jgi:hypothetical protein
MNTDHLDFGGMENSPDFSASAGVGILACSPNLEARSVYT